MLTFKEIAKQRARAEYCSFHFNCVRTAYVAKGRHQKDFNGFFPLDGYRQKDILFDYELFSIWFSRFYDHSMQRLFPLTIWPSCNRRHRIIFDRFRLLPSRRQSGQCIALPCRQFGQIWWPHMIAVGVLPIIGQHATGSCVYIVVAVAFLFSIPQWSPSWRNWTWRP